MARTCLLKAFKSVTLLLLMLLPVDIIAQSKHEQFEIDSFKNVLKHNTTDEQRVITINALCVYTVDNLPQQALIYADSGLHVAQRGKLFKYTTLFYETKGEVYMNKGDFKNAIAQYNLCYAVASKYKIKKLVASAFNGFGAVYEMQGNFALAQTYFFKCLDYAEQQKDDALTATSYANISVVFGSEKNLDKAILYANKTLEKCKQYPYPGLEAKANEVLGNSYAGYRQNARATACYDKALHIYQDEKNEAGCAAIYNLLGSIYNNNPVAELQLLLKAKATYDRIAPNNIYAIENLGDIGIAYAKEARTALTGPVPAKEKSAALFNKAESYLVQGIKLAKAAHVQVAIINLTDSLAPVEAAINKYKDAYLTLRTRNAVSDSIYSQANKNKIAALEGKHEIEIRDKQLKINKLEIENEHRQQLFLSSGGFVLLLIGGLVFYQSLQRKKTSKLLIALNGELDEANKVKTRFFGILNHDLRSPIAGFINFIHLQQNAPDLIDQNQREAYTAKATASAKNLLNTMEDLLLWSKGQMENFKPNIKQVQVEDIFEYINLATVTVNVQLTFEQQPGMVLNTDEHYIKTIMLNLTGNAVKALANTKNPKIEWKAWTQNGFSYLSITDNGPGAAEESLKPLYDQSASVGIKNGLGLHIVRDLAKAIICSIKVTTSTGLGVKVELKFS